MAGLLVAVMAAPALAQTGRGEFAAGDLRFTLPDRWVAEGQRQKLVLVAPGEDGFVEFSLLEPGSDAQLRGQVARALAISLADPVLSESVDVKPINGMPALRIAGAGSSDAIPVQFIAIAVSPRQTQPVLVLAYAAQESFERHAPAFDALFRSLRRR